MATTESRLRQINRRIKQIYDTFGGKSIEYNKVKSYLYASFYESYEYIRSGSSTKPVQLSRGKAAIASFGYAAEIVEDLWQRIAQMGTVKEIKERDYMIHPDDTYLDDSPITIEEIQEASQQEYESSYLDTDVYEDVETAVSDYETELTTSEDPLFDRDYQEALKRAKEVFHEKGKGTREQKWERARQILTKATMRHKIKNRVVHRRSGKGRKDLGSNE